MTTFTPGQQLRITDDTHPKRGHVGALNFATPSRAYITIDHICWPVDAAKVEPVETPEPPAYESEDQYTAAARLCACVTVIAVIGLWAASTF